MSVPARALGDQRDYTIEFEVKRPAATRSGHAISLCSNQDEARKAGMRFLYFPPPYNACWVMVNTYQAEEKRGFLRDAYVKITLVVQDRQLMVFRDGMLMAMTSEVTPSARPVTFGGWHGRERMPKKYALRNIRVYDDALTPTGFDPSVERMRNYSGPGYKVNRVDVKDPSRPRILVIGDSISMGYRGFITEHYKGRAYVDYWVGGAWVNGPSSVLGKNSAVKTAWDGVLSQGPYDVITWNPMGLHMWNPSHQKRRTPEDTYPRMITELVDHITKAKPSRTTVVWVTTTPFCVTGRKNGDVGAIDREKSRFVTKFNAISSDVMKARGIPQVDLWALCEKNLDKVGRDGVHWNRQASELMARALIREIDKYLPARRGR